MRRASSSRPRATPRSSPLSKRRIAVRTVSAPKRCASGVRVPAGATVHGTATDLPDKTAALQALTGQLYVSWDKMLIDMRARNGQYDQQIRTVTTRDGKTTSDEKWITVSSAAYAG